MKARSSPRPRLRFGIAASLAIAVLTLTATFITATIAQVHPPLIIERGLEMKTRDAVTLRADVYRPRADGKFPVILTRTPYDKYGVAGTCTRIAEAGYVCVAQDVRSR